MVSTAVATEEPVEPPPWPVLVMAVELLVSHRQRWPRRGERWKMCWRRPICDPPAAALVAAPANAEAATAEALCAVDHARGRNIDVAQCFRALPELRRHFHDHVILVLVLVDGRDLALAERVIERVVHLADGQAQARFRGAVDLEIDFQALVLLIGIDVLQLGHILQRIGDLGHPLIQLAQIVGLERVLQRTIALAAARAHASRAHRHHEHARAGDGVELGPEPVDHVIGLT